MATQRATIDLVADSMYEFPILTIGVAVGVFAAALVGFRRWRDVEVVVSVPWSVGLRVAGVLALLAVCGGAIWAYLVAGADTSMSAPARMFIALLALFAPGWFVVGIAGLMQGRSSKESIPCQH